MIDDGIFPGLEAHMAASMARSEAAYDTKILRALFNELCGHVRAKELEQEAGDEFGFFWFNDSMACPLILRTSKVKVAPIHLIRSAGMTKTALWQEYFSLKAEYEQESTLGMIFQIHRVSRYVIHNYPKIALEPGFNTVVRLATNPDKALYIMPWQAFMLSLKKVWSV